MKGDKKEGQKVTKSVKQSGKVPLGLLKHQFKPGMAYMQRLAKGK